MHKVLNNTLDRRTFLSWSGYSVAAFLAAPRASLFAAETPQAAPLFSQLPGALLPPDQHGLRLPPGFKSRIIAHSSKPVAGSSYIWHSAPDGGACYTAPDGGWIYVSNSEIKIVDGGGGAGAVRFNAQGDIVDAYALLSGTDNNCAGGRTPCQTWLSCEEVDRGLVYECDPFGQRDAVALPALGRFRHEAVAVDPVNAHLYLTEDETDGAFYRFTPSAAQVLTRNQVAAATRFNGGEGIAWHDGIVYFTTKGDNRVWRYDTSTSRIGVLYDANGRSEAPLAGVDNVTITASGDVLVAEDGGDMQIVLITPAGIAVPIVQVTGQDQSEICGPAFDPSFQRLYFSSQTGPLNLDNDGITYEISRTG